MAKYVDHCKIALIVNDSFNWMIYCVECTLVIGHFLAFHGP